MDAVSGAAVTVMRTMHVYPPGFIGTTTALFGRSIAASHGTDWTLPDLKRVGNPLDCASSS
jgi:hypothetical protein